MKPLPPSALELIRRQHGAVSRRALNEMGVTDSAIYARLAGGEWVTAYPGVYLVLTVPSTTEQAIKAACLAGGPRAVASHQSAAWLWGYLNHRPPRPSLTLPRSGVDSLPGVDVHHRLPQQAVAVVHRSGIRCTDPLRTLVDLAAVAAPNTLNAALDRALMSKTASVAAIEADLQRHPYRGVAGVAALHQALKGRGFAQAPYPSVLESRLLRLLSKHSISVAGVEVVVEGGLYRIDVMVRSWLGVEVDGYRYHSTPEQKQADERRRNRMRVNGMAVLVYSWNDVVADGERVVREIKSVLARFAGETPGPPGE